MPFTREVAGTAAIVLASLVAQDAAAKPLIVRTPGAQLDEAVQAVKAELGSTDELVADDSTGTGTLAERAGGHEVIVAVGARAAQLALKQTAVPVVHCMVLQDAASFDTDRSVGVSLVVPAQGQLKTLKRIIPALRRVGVLYDPKLNARFIDEAREAAKAIGVTLVARSVPAATAAPAAVDEMVGDVDAVWVIPDATVVSREVVGFIVARAFEKRVPVFTYSESLVKAGALGALVPSYGQNGKLCAQLAKRVIAGEKPAALRGAVEMVGGLVLNTSSARRLGISLSTDLLKPPTRVVGE